MLLIRLLGDGPTLASKESWRDVVIVIACFNEERRLPVDRYRLFLASNTTTALAFVDEGSTDRTVNVVDRITTGYEDAVTLLRHSRNLGKGRRWTDVRGSKLTLSDFFVAAWDLVRIYRRHLR